MLAVTHHNYDMVCYLITFGADVKLQSDIAARRILLNAINTNHIETACILITNGIGNDGELDTTPPMTALMWAAKNGHDSLVKYLILQGVNINHQNTNGWTALHFAAHSNHIQCGILLAEAGADLRIVNEDSTTPPQHGCHRV